jgi:cytochrome b6-f complex iron-sulfur subunit
MAVNSGASSEDSPSAEGRRGFLMAASTTAMAGGLAASYGTFAYVAGRFVYPAAAARVAWQYVTSLDRLSVGQSLDYVGPTGARIVVARQGEGQTADDFIALSSVCPHLGCQVHWEAVNQRFFCPCHNGVFNPQGVATEGPPAAAGQALARFPLKIENGLLFIQVPMEGVSLGPAGEKTA